MHSIHKLADKVWSHVCILALRAYGLSGYDVTSMVGIKAAALKSTRKSYFEKFGESNVLTTESLAAAERYTPFFSIMQRTLYFIIAVTMYLF